MSFLEKAREAVKSGEKNDQWVYNRDVKLLVELNLGSGVRMEVTYYTKDDIGLDNIEEAVLYDGGSRIVLDEEEIQVMSDLFII